MATDNDYSLARVPEDAKQPLWRILFIRIGSICCVSQLVLGAALGYGMTFFDAILATLLGSVIIQVISWALGAAAAKEGFSTSLLSRWAGFGKGGAAVFGGILAVAMVGWFGVQNYVFGQGLASVIPLTDFMAAGEYPFWAIITGVGITMLVVFGIRMIAHFATIFVPLFIIAVLYAAVIMLQGHSLGDLISMAPPAPPAALLSLGAAATMVAGGFIAGAVCTPDYARFLKNGKQVFWMTLVGTFVGELGMNLIAVLLAHATGTSAIDVIMMETAGALGVIIVVASTVKLNDINLYSSGLGLMTLINGFFNKRVSRGVIIWTLGIAGTILSVIGIINFFTDYLILLGVAIPPVAGIMVVDYYLLRRKRKQLDESRAKGELPKTVEVWNPVALITWVAGFAVGQLSSMFNFLIPGLNSLIFAGILYWIVMVMLAKIQKVEVVSFKETDQVL